MIVALVVAVAVAVAAAVTSLRVTEFGGGQRGAPNVFPLPVELVRPLLERPRAAPAGGTAAL